MSTVIATTPRTTLKRLPKRGSFERATLRRILDEGLVCHVGFVGEGGPVVIPTAYGRKGDTLFLHGSAAGRMLKTVGGGVDVCVTVTLVDSLVLARSAFHHSMNYRSVMILGLATEVTAEAEKRAALTAIVERVLPGRASEVRGPDSKELNATIVLSLPIEEASAKIRTGPPLDAEEDYALPCWAGVLPLKLTALAPLPDPRLPEGIAVPAALAAWKRGAGARRS